MSFDAARKSKLAAVPEVEETDAGWREAVSRALEGMRFGAVELVVHEGRVVQIVRTEKVRIEAK
jgi:hypothetical protein